MKSVLGHLQLTSELHKTWISEMQKNSAAVAAPAAPAAPPAPGPPAPAPPTTPCPPTAAPPKPVVILQPPSALQPDETEIITFGKVNRHRSQPT
jgi:hypothetical protein